MTRLRIVCLLVICAAGPAAAQVVVPPGSHVIHDIRPGPGVTSSRLLSSWAPSVLNTPGDTRAYVLDGQEPGATVVVVGGTHGNEIAGVMTAILLVERVRVQKGRLIVIPHANNSAITDVDPQRPGPPFITVATPGGDRHFKYGSRRTRPTHQGAPDPPVYLHPASAEELPGAEARNLNRAYPGVADGTLTQRVAFAILELIRTEKAALAFDLHEAGPESRLAWMIIAHPKNLDMAATAVFDLEVQGLSMKLEPSSASFRGLSHREWGDASAAMAFLFETPSPSMVDDTSRVDFVNDPRLPLAKRIGGHLASLAAVLAAYNAEAGAGAMVTWLDLPSMADVEKAGVGAFLK